MAISSRTGKVFPSHTPEAKKRDHLKPLGWTLEQFNSALELQNHKCAVCGKLMNLDKLQNGARACADHVHSVPPVSRGVICTNCNAGIGQFQDNPAFLESAAAYIRRYQ